VAALPSESALAISTTSSDVGLTESAADLPAGDAPRTLEVWVNDGGGAAAFDLLRYGGNVRGGHGFEVTLGDNAASIVVTAGDGSVSAPNRRLPARLAPRRRTTVPPSRSNRMIRSSAAGRSSQRER
jgi:hypothetical protein